MSARQDKDSEIRKEDIAPDEEELLNRRDFLVGLKKWSKAVIGGALLAGALTDREAAAGSWVNRRGGGAGWINGGGGGWVNGGASWINGGGGGWVNRRGGLGWINRR